MSSLGPSALDFWVGSWDCDFSGGGGTNVITAEMGGRVIVERFHLDRPRPFTGMSVSTFHEHRGMWLQTWVDEDGAYWNFEEGTVDGDLCFRTPHPVDADNVFKRMVFSDIADDTFNWRWESSPDEESWTVNWELRYRRRTEPEPDRSA
ncbi:MAG: hypothetical protein AAF531_18665 [Actinomycetota bacterium]